MRGFQKGTLLLAILCVAVPHHPPVWLFVSFATLGTVIVLSKAPSIKDFFPLNTRQRQILCIGLPAAIAFDHDLPIEVITPILAIWSLLIFARTDVREMKNDFLLSLRTGNRFVVWIKSMLAMVVGSWFCMFMLADVSRVCESAWFNVGDEVTRFSRSREWPDIFVVDKDSPRAFLRADWKDEVISLDVKLLDSASEMKDFLIATDGKKISLYLYGEEEEPLLFTALKMSDFEQTTETRNKQENMTLSMHKRLVCTKDLYRRLLKERVWRLVP